MLAVAAGSLCGNMGLVSHQLLPILDISISLHPLTIWHRRLITSLSCVLHIRMSLNHLYPKGKEKINVWVIVMPLLPRKSGAVPAELFDLDDLNRVLNITGSVALDSQGRTRFYGGSFQMFRRL